MKKLWQKWVNAQRIGCLIVGPLFIGFSFIWVLHTLWFEHHADHAQGVITEVLHRRDEDGNTVYAPVFKFQSNDGRVVTATSSVWISPAPFEENDKVPVIYSRSDPSNARIDSFSQLWLAPVMFGCAGAFSLLIGLWLQRRYQKRKKGINSARVIT